MNRLKDQAQTSSNAERYYGRRNVYYAFRGHPKIGQLWPAALVLRTLFRVVNPPHNRDLLQIELLKRLIMRIHV